MVPRLLTRSYKSLEHYKAARCGWTYSFRHTNTGITDCERLVDLVGNNVDAEVLAGIKLAWV